MAKVLNRLAPRTVEARHLDDGMYADGDGLWLRVRGGHRHWLFIYRWEGKQQQIGLGASPRVKLTTAREKAHAIRDQLAKGKDPKAERKALAAIPTFGELADEWIEARTGAVRNDKSVARWKRTLGEKGYAASLRPLRVDKVTIDDVLRVLKPIWSLGATAPLARGYIEAVLVMATARKHRAGDNPARAEQVNEAMGGAPKKLARGHHKAMAYADVPSFMAKLREIDSTAARQVELTVLTATRVSEPRLAVWGEFDLDAALWTIPAERTKTNREHRVPLSPRAASILRSLRPAKANPAAYVFPTKLGKPLSNMAGPMLLRRLVDEVTVHGFRSSFSDWAYDKTEHAEETIEQSLAHVIGTEVRRAYRRGDGLDKRRALMEAWAAYCGSVVEGVGGAGPAANDDVPESPSIAAEA